MDGVHFRYLEKQEFDLYAPRLFSLLYNNMMPIAPLEESYEEAEALWCRTFGGAFKGREARKLLLVLDGEELIGFFGFLAAEDTFHMEEIQIAPAYQGKYGIFRRILTFVLRELPTELCFVEAYAHKSNEKSLSIQRHLGLSVIGENKNGNCFHLRGDMAALRAWAACGAEKA